MDLVDLDRELRQSAAPGGEVSLYVSLDLYSIVQYTSVWTWPTLLKRPTPATRGTLSWDQLKMNWQGFTSPWWVLLNTRGKSTSPPWVLHSGFMSFGWWHSLPRLHFGESQAFPSFLFSYQFSRNVLQFSLWWEHLSVLHNAGTKR